MRGAVRVAERKRGCFGGRVDLRCVCQGALIRGNVVIPQLLGIKNNCCWSEERKNGVRNEVDEKTK